MGSDRMPCTVIGIYEGEPVFAWVRATTPSEAWDRAVALTCPGEAPTARDAEGNAVFAGICFAIFDGWLPQGLGIDLMPPGFVRENDDKTPVLPEVSDAQ